jgi:rhodanese-related sulfurtransferase
MSLLGNLFGTREKTDFKELLQKGAIIIDVRTPAEFQTGHIPGSINIALEQIGATINSLRLKNKPLIMVCRSGVRSSTATALLKKAGLETYNGGGWNDLMRKIK